MVKQVTGAAASAERFEPHDADGTLTASEHYLRYLWASAVVEGKSVLDAGCGTGYGAGILRTAGATRVIGVDIAADAGAGTDGDFVVADVHQLPFGDSEFDVVTCFEVIEHVEERDVVIAELKRVLRDDGLLMISSPNRTAYPAGNPYHIFEYLPEELRADVGARFSEAKLYRQDAWLASMITSADGSTRVDPGAARDLPVHLSQSLDKREPYAIVVASDGDLPALSDRLMIGDPVEVRWWHDQHEELERARTSAEVELKQARAAAEYELAGARERARLAGAALIELESQRAVELEILREAEHAVATAREAHDQAHQVIQAMQRTRLWRLGSFYWRLRDRLSGRTTA